jgi:type IV pilus assembly protein PilM
LDRVTEISSTEKLLKVIRDKDGAPVPPGQGKSQPQGAGQAAKSSSPLISLKKSSTVGIDIGHAYLRLVRAVEGAGGKWQVIDRRRLPVPPRVSRDAPEFAAFLKSALADFCASAKQSQLWAIMSSANVELHHVRIPRVGKKQIAGAVYWAARKEASFDEKEALLDFEVQGEVVDQGIPKLAVMLYTAPRREVEDLRNLFSGIGWPLSGISLVPFAVQNQFRTGWIPAGEESLAHLFIGNDFSRIDVYADGDLVMTRGIKAGNTSMVEALVEQYNDSKNPEAAPLTMEEGRKILDSLSPDSPPLKEGDAGFSLAKEEVFGMIEPALDRLVRQVERTFEHFASTSDNVKIGKIFVTGAMNIYPPIIDYVGNQLGIASEVLDPLSEMDSIPACLDVEDAHCLSERIAFTPALGMALSRNDYTQNLLFTYRDKETAAGVSRWNRALLAGFVVLALLCGGVYTYQSMIIQQKNTVLEGLEAQLASLGPQIDRNLLQSLAVKVSQKRQLSMGYAERYLGMVVISELTALTPSNIRFLDLKLNPGPAPAQGAPSTKASPAAKGGTPGIVLEGLILGDRQSLETSLAGYVMALDASPIFREIVIQKNTVEPYLKKEALHFTLNLKVEEQVHG